MSQARWRVAVTNHGKGALGLALSCLSASAVLAQVPAEVRDLRIVGPNVTWAPTVNATHYELYRGDRDSLGDIVTPLAESCRVGRFETTDSGPVLEAEPPPNGLHWFLVSAANGAGEGTVGAGRSRESWGDCCGEITFADDFAGANGSPWTARWSEAHEVDAADLQDGWARMRPRLSGYSLGRYTALGDARDVEVSFLVRFDDVATQGVGFYVRSNRGYLQSTATHGQGYAVFVEGFRGTPGIGVWKEEDGSEISLEIDFDAALNLMNGVPYRVRFRVLQETPTATRLQARIWPDAGVEPATWRVDYLDASVPALQGISGGFAIDSWSSHTTGGPTPLYTSVADVRVRRLCNPLEAMPPVSTLQETFTFTEGPVWRDGSWRFTDLGTDTIHDFAGTGPATVFRSPCDLANGLAYTRDGDLLACEHRSRRVSTSQGAGPTSPVVDRYMGLRFNSPNDLALRGDGVLFFTDPPYGLAMPALREIPFNGLFRLLPDGTLSAEWQGDAATSGPNGVDFSPDQRTLYLADTAQGSVYAFDVAGDGSLSLPRPFASGLNTPDGLTVDMAGNVYVATWANTIEVFLPTGERWGSIPIPRQATNCAFGGADRKTLFVTAHEGVYAVDLVQPGLR